MFSTYAHQPSRVQYVHFSTVCKTAKCFGGCWSEPDGRTDNLVTIIGLPLMCISVKPNDPKDPGVQLALDEAQGGRALNHTELEGRQPHKEAPENNTTQ